MEFEPPSEPLEVPATAAAALDAAAKRLLPVLLHRVNNSTQVVLGVDALLREGNASRFGGDLARASEDVHEIGWLFGVLAAGLNADTLVARVERDGLSAVVRWALLAVRRAGRDLSLAGFEGVRLEAPPHTAPRVAFALAFLCVRAADSREPGAVVTVELERTDSAWTITLDASVDEASAAWLAGCGGTALVRRDRSCKWSLPLAWLAPRDTAAQ